MQFTFAGIFFFPVNEIPPKRSQRHVLDVIQSIFAFRGHFLSLLSLLLLSNKVSV